jgi:hypothetical protein
MVASGSRTMIETAISVGFRQLPGGADVGDVHHRCRPISGRAGSLIRLFRDTLASLSEQSGSSAK